MQPPENWQSRLDRIEGILENMAKDREAANAEIRTLRSDVQVLLTSQVLLTDSQRKVNVAHEKLAGVVEALSGSQLATDRKLQQLAESQALTESRLRQFAENTEEKLNALTENLNALIAVVDDIVRKRPPEQSA